MDSKNIKAEIKRLKKLKLQCRAGSKERIQLYRQIKELKKQLNNMNILDDEKIKIINEILQKDKLLTRININLNKFSIADLKKHLVLITKRGRND